MIFTVVGARPNFIKMAPIVQELQRRSIAQVFIHTGQHYDDKMSAIFFEQLMMPTPDIYLGIKAQSHAEQTAKIMMAFESVCLENRPSLLVVAGDVNSTLACALTSAKLNIPVAHVESGLRSFDRTMPEEINRILTDHLCDLLFTTEQSATQNLYREGIAADNIHFVGNTMIDTLYSHVEKALALKPWDEYGLIPGQYCLVTFHRPSNVDSDESAYTIADALYEISKHLPVIFPIHPRTLAKHTDLWLTLPGVRVTDPLGYLQFLGLMARAAAVVTDSGGVQEETTALGIDCITVRKNTERPVTITEGTNRLVNLSVQEIVQAVLTIQKKQANVPLLWDGHAAERTVDIIQAWLQHI